VVLGLGASLFVAVYRLNHRYGQFGLMKRAARRRLPTAARARSRRVFRLMNTEK